MGVLLNSIWFVVLIAVFYHYWKKDKREAAQEQPREGDAAGQGAEALPSESAQIPVAAHYRSDKVGNDAAARPWDHGVEQAALPVMTMTMTEGGANAAALGAAAEAGLAARPDQLPDRVPAHVDLALLLERSKACFMRLHAAWEKGDVTAVRELLTPAIWQQVDQAMQTKVLPDWGRRMGEVQHLAARALQAREENGDLRVQLEFTGSQWLEEEAKSKAIHEVWDVAYAEAPMRWQIVDLQSAA